jgi:hypothetical protein
MYATRSFFLLGGFFLFGCSPFYTTWRSPLSAGLNTHLLLHLRHDTAGRWMRGGPGGCTPDMFSRVKEGQETKWNQNAKKSEKLERGTCVCMREIMGVTALSLSCYSTRFFLFSFRSISRYDVPITATAAWVHRGVEACKETPLRSVSAEQLHNHMNDCYHPAGLGGDAPPPQLPSPRSAHRSHSRSSTLTL